MTILFRIPKAVILAVVVHDLAPLLSIKMRERTGAHSLPQSAEPAQISRFLVQTGTELFGQAPRTSRRHEKNTF